MYAVPDDEPLGQLFLPDGGQWGEIRRHAAGLQIELFAPQGQTNWVVDVEDLLQVISIAKQKLIGD